MRKKVFFVTFEGTDGVGKSTHARKTAQWLESQNIPVLLTREPGGGPLAEQVRALLLDPKNKMQPLTELLLYQAARVEHIQNVILPALKNGTTVICDRFTDATMAYQGHGRGLKKQTVVLNNLVCAGLKPDLTLLFDLAPQMALKKAQARGNSGQGDRMEQEGLGFQEKVRRGYLLGARNEPKRIRVIRVKPSIEETEIQIRRYLTTLIHGNSRPTARA